nr:MAG TPA: Receptor Binding Protein [Caudoviricetes sp.]
MAVTYGFYNSVNGDRKYDATQISSMFDGLIIDGVFSSIGTCFAVKAKNNITVEVGIGKAWFNHTWIYNDAILPVTLPVADPLLDRIDAIVIEIDSSDSVRENSIKTVMGIASSTPKEPFLKKEPNIHQYPICYIYRKRATANILQEHITNKVGSPDCPFIIGVLKTINLTQLLGQWENELSNFTQNKRAEFDSWWGDLQNDTIELRRKIDKSLNNIFFDFQNWYDSMKNQLSTDAAGNLQLAIDRKEIEQVLLIGFASGKRIISNNGTVITSTSDDGRKLVKTFSNNFKAITNVLISKNGEEIARLTKTYSEDGQAMFNSLVIR